jgi:hypothetical protein
MKAPLINRIKKLESSLTPNLSPEEQELSKVIRERRLKVFGEEECRIRDAFHEKYPLPQGNDLAVLILAARKTLPLYEKFKSEYKKDQ